MGDKKISVSMDRGSVFWTLTEPEQICHMWDTARKSWEKRYNKTIMSRSAIPGNPLGPSIKINKSEKTLYQLMTVVNHDIDDWCFIESELILIMIGHWLNWVSVWLWIWLRNEIWNDSFQFNFRVKKVWFINSFFITLSLSLTITISISYNYKYKYNL